MMLECRQRLLPCSRREPCSTILRPDMMLKLVAEVVLLIHPAAAIQNTTANLGPFYGACGKWRGSGAPQGGALPFPMAKLFITTVGGGDTSDDGAAVVTGVNQDGEIPFGIAEGAGSSKEVGLASKGTYKGACLSGADPFDLPCDCVYILADCTYGQCGPGSPDGFILEMSCTITNVQHSAATCFVTYMLTPSPSGEATTTPAPWWLAGGSL